MNKHWPEKLHERSAKAMQNQLVNICMRDCNFAHDKPDKRCRICFNEQKLNAFRSQRFVARAFIDNYVVGKHRLHDSDENVPSSAYLCQALSNIFDAIGSRAKDESDETKESKFKLLRVILASRFEITSSIISRVIDDVSRMVSLRCESSIRLK